MKFDDNAMRTAYPMELMIMLWQWNVSNKTRLTTHQPSFHY